MVRPQPKLPTETDRQFFRRNYIALGLGAFWFFVNVNMSWFFSIDSGAHPSGLLVFGALGVLSSQVILLAFFLALFPASLLFRAVTVATASLAIGGSLLVGAMVFDNWKFADLIKFDGFPMVLISFATPFSLARYFLGWRLDYPWLNSSDHSNMSVMGLMMSTAAVAISISILGLDGERFLIWMLVFSAGCLGASFAVFVPMTFLVLRSRWPIGWLIGWTAVPFLIGMAITWTFFANPVLSFWIGTGITVFVTSMALGYVIGLIVFRNKGARLLTVHDTPEQVQLAGEKSGGAKRWVDSDNSAKTNGSSMARVEH